MSAAEAIGTAIALIMLIVTAITAGPAIWRFMCLPGRIEQRLEKLDQLPGIKDAADQAHAASERAAEVAERAASIASEAHEEWKGATKVVTHEMARLAAAVERQQRKIDEIDGRVRKIEQQP